MKFKAMVDSKTIRNYISLETIKWLGLLYRQKRDLYPLVMILGNPIIHRNGIIYFEIRPVELKLEGKYIVMSFEVLLLEKDKAVLGMPFLQKYNLRINWTTGDIKLWNIK